jgi:hypothetical protein
MGSRHVAAVVGAVILQGAIPFLSAAVEPEWAGAATITVKACGGGSITVNEREKRIFGLHNQTRADHGLKRPCADPHLTRAAPFTSEGDGRKGLFRPLLLRWQERRRPPQALRLRWGVWGENIAGGCGASEKPGPIFERWTDSTPHRANILDGRPGGSAWEPTRATTRVSKGTPCTRSISGVSLKLPGRSFSTALYARGVGSSARTVAVCVVVRSANKHCRKRKRPAAAGSGEVAGAGFEPATFGL